MRPLPLALGPLLLLAGSPALAQETMSPAVVQVQPEPSSAPPATAYAPPASAPTYKNEWYGWQIIIPDAVGVSLVAASLGTDPSGNGGTALAVSAVTILALDGLVVHLVHRRYGIAAASLGVRVGGAILGAIVGGVVASGGNHDSDQDVPPGVVGVIFGFGFGAMAGMVVDDAVLSWQRVPVARPEPASGGGFHLALAPLVGPRQEGLSVVGTF